MKRLIRISLKEIADDCGVLNGTIHKIVKRLEIPTEKRRDADRGNQLVTTVSGRDVEKIRDALSAGRRRRGIIGIEDEDEGGEGYFYLIQLEPDHDKQRYKVGFSTDVVGRLAKHRCSAPFAQCLKSWPCRRTWEKAAIDCASIDCEQLHTEVFRASDINTVITRCDRFFDLMPKPNVCDSVEDDD